MQPNVGVALQKNSSRFAHTYFSRPLDYFLNMPMLVFILSYKDYQLAWDAMRVLLEWFVSIHVCHKYKSLRPPHIMHLPHVSSYFGLTTVKMLVALLTICNGISFHQPVNFYLHDWWVSDHFQSKTYLKMVFNTEKMFQAVPDLTLFLQSSGSSPSHYNAFVPTSDICMYSVHVLSTFLMLHSEVWFWWPHPFLLRRKWGLVTCYTSVSCAALWSVAQSHCSILLQVRNEQCSS